VAEVTIMSNESLTRSTIAPLILRLALGAILIYHGVDKVRGPNNEWGAAWAVTMPGAHRPPQEVMNKLDEMAESRDENSKARYTRDEIKRIKEGLSLAYAQEDRVPEEARMELGAGVQVAVAWGELLGGIALVLGLFTRLSALGALIIQAGAIATVTWARGFAGAQGGGYEYNLALIAICLALVISGGGRLSVDRLLLATHKDQATPPQPVAA